MSSNTMDAATVQRVQELIAPLSRPDPLDERAWAQLIAGLLVAGGAPKATVGPAVERMFRVSLS